MTAQRRYRAEPHTSMVLRPLEELDLLYHRPSGQTHMVMSPVPEILAALAGAPNASAEAIRDVLAQDFDLGAPDEALAVIIDHLEELVQLGLVRHA